MPKSIHLVAAARPNFMKIAPLYHALLGQDWARPVIVHTGQHYDACMSSVFFQDLNLPEPHAHLGIGSGTHAEQTGKTMIAYERLLAGHPPDLCVVVGDVNATLACALTAVKLGVKTAHLEAGLRSFDRTMPEEINRIATDALCDILWTPSPDADANLLREGVDPAKIENIGNIMIDSLEMRREGIEQDRTRERLGLEPGRYALVTLHRPANVDNPATLEVLCRELRALAGRLRIVFPVHPRTKNRLELFGLLKRLQDCPEIMLLEPQPYVAFMNLLFGCKLAVTDSGGIQEETTYIGIPCLTVRPNTERPVTVTLGTNRLCPPEELAAQSELAMGATGARRPELWDGHTAERAVASIRARLGLGLAGPKGERA